MIIARTPFRVSFFGGGTDMEYYYSEHEGKVLSTAINKYMYITVHPFCRKDCIQVKYSKTELVNHVAEIAHPIVRTCLQKLQIGTGVEITSVADVPSGTGLGSSSSFTVCLLHGLNAYLNKYVTKEYLASEACDIEINILREPIGKQDQYAAAYGGMNILTFGCNGSVKVEPVIISQARQIELEENLLMFFTGKSRDTGSILSKQKEAVASNRSKNRVLSEMCGLVDNAYSILTSGNLDDFGRTLDGAWQLKRSLLNAISDPEIDSWYNKAVNEGGALGGKLLGAGGGGYLLLYCKKEHQDKLRHVLGGLEELRFKFDKNGSHVIFYDNNE
jgi:D-glycero-alpha-D-manno-heptose-7-phosphate kinase